MELQYRMYGFVPYNISPIQQGIQFGHAVVEYGNIYGQEPAYHRWSRIDKTFIILNGGTTNTSGLNSGTLNQHAMALKSIYDVPTAEFYEPDLGDQLTAVVFLVDERVWDYVKYPDFSGTYFSNSYETMPDPTQYAEWKKQFTEDLEEAEQIINLRKFLRNFKLA